MIETIFTQSLQSAVAGRAVPGLVLAAIAAGVAWRMGSLSRSGFVAAVACGTLCVIAGWSWALLLIFYFVAASALSRAGIADGNESVQSVVAKGGARDAVQVIANGGVYAVAAALALTYGTPDSSALAWGALGALAASSADTWATEIGVGLGGSPRSIISRTYVRPGESGGVTGAGLLGSAAGAAWIGLLALLLGFSHGAAIACLITGVAGALADSVLGATIQERRHCDTCNLPTERLIHRCGSATRRVGGIARLNNDVVNVLSTFAGLLLGVTLYFIAGSWGRG